MDESLFKKFKDEVDAQFLDMQKNRANEEDSRRYMETDEYNEQVNIKFKRVKVDDDIAAVAASCAYCLYMMY